MVQPSGILWVGPVLDMGGYGNASRNLLRSMQHIGLPIRLVNIGDANKEIGEEDIDLIFNIVHSKNDLGDYPVLIIHSAPDYYVNIKKDGFFKKIGITVFETDRIPENWVSLCNDMDEIWVPTQFNYRTFTESGVEPSKVKIVPHAIDVKQYTQTFDPFPFPAEVKSFKFLYTLAFDFRKGLDLLIPSFCEEFSNTEDVSLIVKMYIPGWTKQENIPELVASYIPDKKNNPHIHFIIENTPRKDLLSLYSSSTCYVSTERGYGWGMPQMEMMVMGKPVISVNWGGGTEYMNNKNAFLIEPEPELEWVHPELQRTRPEIYLRHKWAKVTKESVRKIMREAFQNDKKREKIALQAQLDITNKYSTHSIAEQIKELLFA